MKDLLIILLSAMPIGEFRLSLPFALTVYHFSIARALFDVYIGNALPVLPLLYGLNRFVMWCDARSKLCHNVLQKVFQRTDAHLRGRYEKYGAVALFLWVAMTIPPTGVWSACIGAVLFGIRPKVAIPAIIGGMVVAGLIVTAVTQGVVTGVNLL